GLEFRRVLFRSAALVGMGAEHGFATGVFLAVEVFGNALEGRGFAPAGVNAHDAELGRLRQTKREQQKQKTATDYTDRHGGKVRSGRLHFPSVSIRVIRA